MENLEKTKAAKANKLLKLGIVGSRRRSSPKDKEIIKEYLIKLLEKDIELLVISGGCPIGADKFAKELCADLGIQFIEFLPDEKLLPENPTYFDRVQMYYARNKLIAEHSQAILALAAEDRKGGTENTIKEAEKLGKTILIR